MEIEQIKEWIQEEFNNDNKLVYKKIRSLCNKLYRNDNKEKVTKWNKTYYKKVKCLDV